MWVLVQFLLLWNTLSKSVVQCYQDQLFCGSAIFVIILEHPLLIQYSSKVIFGSRPSRMGPLVVKADWNEWFSSNRRLSYVHRIMGSPGGKHCKLLQRNVWRGAVSPLEAVSLDRECNILPWFYEKRRWPMLLRRNCKSLWDQCDEIYW